MAQELYKGDVVMTAHQIIPFLLFFTKTVMSGKNGKGIVWSVHVTPFIAFSFITRHKNV